jgi:hypothetical protein
MTGPTADGTDKLDAVCGHVTIRRIRVSERRVALACNNRDGNITRQKGLLRLGGPRDEIDIGSTTSPPLILLLWGFLRLGVV